jgi:hypothetical protein
LHVAGLPVNERVPLEALLEIRLLLPEDEQSAEEIDVRIAHLLVRDRHGSHHSSSSSFSSNP